MTAVAPLATSAELGELLGLMHESDSVELKATVPLADQRSTLMSLGLDPLEAQIRLVVFFDTPDLALDKCGVVVRARRIQGKGDDSVVKLRRLAGFRVEVDALPGGFVCSGTLKEALKPPAVQSALSGELPIRKLFCKEQREYFAAHAPEGVRLDDLVPLGPLFVLKVRFVPPELGRRVVAELWLFPDGSRVLELSTRCGTDEAFQVAAETRAFLAGRGVDLSGEQQTKTRKALEYFAGQQG